MGISLNNIKNDKRTIEAEYFGDSFKITYKPSELTPAKESKIVEASQAGDNTELVKTLTEMIVSWEVWEVEPTKDTPGVAMPIDEETLTNVSSAFLGAVLHACRLDMIPKAKNGRR